MKIFIPLFLITLYLSGCAQNDNDQNVTTRTENGTDLSRVKYTPKHGGPAMTTGDISDPGLDVHKNRRNDNITNSTYQNRIDREATLDKKVSAKAARAVMDIPDVNRSTVIVADNNAYVAVELNDALDNTITTDLEDLIFRRVKEADQDIDNVFISANPEFNKRLTRYADDMRTGKSTNGFSDTIRREFPDAK